MDDAKRISISVKVRSGNEIISCGMIYKTDGHDFDGMISGDKKEFEEALKRGLEYVIGEEYGPTR